MIPADWEVKTVGTLCNEVIDCDHATPVWTTSGFLVIRNQNIRNGKLDFSQPSYTDEAHFLKRIRRAIPSFGDLIITREAPMGLVCMIPENLTCCLGQRMVLLRPNQIITNTKYLLYAILSEDFQYSISVAGGTGSTVSNLRIPVLKNLPLPLPPLPEQRAIAAALSDVDALIGALEALIAKKRAIKQATMQQLLTGQTRLPGFATTTAMQQTEVGLIPADWEVKRLGEVGEITTGFKDVNEGNISGLYPFFTCSKNHTFSDNYSFDTEAILVAGNGDVGNLHYYNGRFEAYQRTYVITNFKQTVNYIWQNLNYSLANFLGIGKIGSSIPYIKMENLTHYLLPFPSLAEQTAIAAVLSDMDAELAALEAQLHKTRAIKQGMMQELLTGKTRLIVN
jgi:type I restriction enzyme S subunit